MHSTDSPLYIFAYGSLIWRPGFEATGRYRASADGWARRFWQSSHDHRGTPAAPGRVVTLVPLDSERCEGLLWEIDARQRQATLELLDHREQDGYERVTIEVEIVVRGPGSALGEHRSCTAITWIASEGNPSWAGATPEDALAALIAEREGPSGSNADYLFGLDTALRELDIADPHVALLARRVEAMHRDGRAGLYS